MGECVDIYIYIYICLDRERMSPVFLSAIISSHLLDPNTSPPHSRILPYHHPKQCRPREASGRPPRSRRRPAAPSRRNRKISKMSPRASIFPSTKACRTHQVCHPGHAARPLRLTHPLDPKVHIGDNGTIYDASLNQSQVANNNNKFYRLQLLQDGKKFHVHTRWGRVGEFG